MFVILGLIKPAPDLIRGNPGRYWMPVEDPVFCGDQVRHDMKEKIHFSQLRHTR